MSYESRARIADDRIPLEATGSVLDFPRNCLTYFAKTGATTVVLTCGALSALPPGLRFTLDNSNGSGSMTLTPTSGSVVTITTGKVYEFYVTAAGGLKAAEIAATP